MTDDFKEIPRWILRTHMISFPIFAVHWSFWGAMFGMYHWGPLGWGVYSKTKFLEITSPQLEIFTGIVSLIGWTCFPLFAISGCLLSVHTNRFRAKMHPQQKKQLLAVYIVTIILILISISAGILVRTNASWQT